MSGGVVQGAPGGEPLAADTIRRTLAEVLERPEFRDEESWFGRLLERIFGALDLPMPGPAAGRVAFVVLLLAALGLAAFVSMHLYREVAARRRARTPEFEPAPGDGGDGAGGGGADARARAAELMRSARAARDRGELALALRLFFFALVVGLGRRGALEYRDSWTNRELLERGRPTPEVERELAGLVGELDHKGFGLEPTRLEDVGRLEALCGRMLGGAP